MSERNATICCFMSSCEDTTGFNNSLMLTLFGSNLDDDAVIDSSSLLLGPASLLDLRNEEKEDKS